MAAYVRWLVWREWRLVQGVRQHVTALREEAARSSMHRRTPDVIATLALGLRCFLQFARDVGAISATEEQRRWDEGWRVLGRAAERQAAHQAASEPTTRFLDLIKSALASGNAHFSGSDGQRPAGAEAWGWRSRLTGTGAYEREDWQPQGERIGWVDGEDVYLDPDASYKTAQAMAAGGEGLAVSAQTLRKRLHEKGLLLREGKRDELTVRRVLSGSSRRVLLLAPGTLICQEPAKPAIPDIDPPGAPENGDSMAGSMAGFTDPPPETRHQNPPSDPAGAPENAADGGNGGNGGLPQGETPAGNEPFADYEVAERETQRSDDVPAPPDKAVTRPGDLWLLGDHRLVCGDSAKSEDVDRLLDGAEVHLAHMDPPYNVKVEPRSNNAYVAGETTFHPVTQPEADAAKRKRSGAPPAKPKVKATTGKMRAKDRGLENDNVSDDEFARLLDLWFSNVARVLRPGRAFYIWGGYANIANYPPALARHELYFSQGIVWDKQHPVLTRKDFMGAFELAFYGWRLGAAHKFFGPTNATDLWPVKKLPSQQMEHLTAKPAELAVRAMQYSSLKGENVLDPFGGSGSTLIAAEQTGRKAYVMEIDPLYCDVICDRYQRFTGRKAVLKRTGKSPIPMKPREEAMR